MGRFPTSEAASESPSTRRFPISEASSGSPSVGRLPPVEAGSSKNRSTVGRSQHCSPAGPSQYCCPARPSQYCCPARPSQRCTPAGQHGSLAGPSQHCLPAMPPPKPSKSMRSPRPFSSKMERNCSSDARLDLKLHDSSNEEFVPAEKQPSSSSTIVIPLSEKKLSADSEDVAEETDAGEGEEEKVREARVEEEQVQEKWNLGPRKSAGKCITGAGKEPQWSQGSPPQKIPKKKEKRMKLSVALSRREIEEDMFAMTGSRLSRKPKKRPKKLQDMVDHLSPAFSLQTVTPSLYNSRG